MREAVLRAVRRISRRRFLALAAAAPVLPLLPAAAGAVESSVGSDIVVRDGWVLRRSDLPKLRLP